MSIITNIFDHYSNKSATDVNQRSYIADLNDYNNSNPINGLIKFGSISIAERKALSISTVYRAVNLISDSIASMYVIPYERKDNWLYPKEDSIFNLLNIQPNSLMSAFTFKKMIIQSLLLKGNAYILIKRNTAGVNELKLLLNVTTMISKDDIKYKDNDSGITYDKSQIVHIKNFTNDGLTGLSTVYYATNSLDSINYAEEQSKNYFTNGGNATGVLSPAVGFRPTTDQNKAAKQAFINATSIDSGSGGLVVLDGGYTYQSISLNPVDLQLLETRKYNVLDVARWFNVPPSMLFDNNAKYSTQEQEQLAFLTQTLQPLIEKLENELFRKLYLPSEWLMNDLKFDTESLIRLDAAAKTTYYQNLFNMGALTTNEIRLKLALGNPVIGGNRNFVNTNVQPIDNIIYDANNNNNQNNNQ